MSSSRIGQFVLAKQAAITHLQRAGKKDAVRTHEALRGDKRMLPLASHKNFKEQTGFSPSAYARIQSAAKKLDTRVQQNHELHSALQDKLDRGKKQRLLGKAIHTLRDKSQQSKIDEAADKLHGAVNFGTLRKDYTLRGQSDSTKENKAGTHSSVRSLYKVDDPKETTLNMLSSHKRGKTPKSVVHKPIKSKSSFDVRMKALKAKADQDTDEHRVHVGPRSTVGKKLKDKPKARRAFRNQKIIRRGAVAALGPIATASFGLPVIPLPNVDIPGIDLPKPNLSGVKKWYTGFQERRQARNARFDSWLKTKLNR